MESKNIPTPAELGIGVPQSSSVVPQSSSVVPSPQALGIGVPSPQDLGVGGATNTQNPQASDGLWSALGYNLGMGTTDSVRGGAQILDLKEDEMKAQQAKLNANLEQYGAPAWAAYIGGLFIDPVAWQIQSVDINT